MGAKPRRSLGAAGPTDSERRGTSSMAVLGEIQGDPYKDIRVKDDPDDRAYHEIVHKIAPYTMTLREGLAATYALFQAVRYLAQNRIAGDVAECGVWRGGSMMLVAHALKHFGDTSRQLYLYDTFEGMPEPDEVDVDFDGNSMKAVWTKAKAEGRRIGYGGTVDTVRFALNTTGYP